MAELIKIRRGYLQLIENHIMRKKCPNMEFFLVRISLYSDTFHAGHIMRL